MNKSVTEWRSEWVCDWTGSREASASKNDYKQTNEQTNRRTQWHGHFLSCSSQLKIEFQQTELKLDLAGLSLAKKIHLEGNSLHRSYKAYQPWLSGSDLLLFGQGRVQQTSSWWPSALGWYLPVPGQWCSCVLTMIITVAVIPSDSTTFQVSCMDDLVLTDTLNWQWLHEQLYQA